ncbi:hypothetical protein H4W00_000298 [Psychrobacter sp. PL19]
MNQTATTQAQQVANANNIKTDTNSKSSSARTDMVKMDRSVETGFYDFYLAEHQNMACRRLHFAGSSFGLLGIANSIRTRSPKPLLKGIAAGYACAWVGHFFFEKNKPASFKFPLKSFVSDFRMYGDVLRGNLSLKDRTFDKPRQQ